MYFIIVCNLLFFSICTYIEYSGRNYDIIHSNKTAIEITRPDTINTDDFFNLLIDISRQCDVDIYYEKIEAALSGHPNYSIYKTNISPDFLNLQIENKDDTILLINQSLTSDTDLSNNQYHIIGSSLLFDLNIYSLEALNFESFKNGIFYTNNDDVSKLTTCLANNKISSAIIKNIQYNDIVPEWQKNQTILLVLLVICMIVYFFSKKKEYVIKKLSGYSNMVIYIEELKYISTFSLMIISLILLILGFFLLGFNRTALGSCLSYFIKNYYFAIIVLIVITAISGLYIFTQCCAEDINGKNRNLEIAIISFLTKGIIIIFCILQVTNLTSTLYQYNNLKYTISNQKKLLEHKYYVPFSAASTDIDGNITEYSNRSKKLLDDMFTLFGTDNIFIIDAEEYDEIETNISCFVLVNNTYLNDNRIKNVDGTYISIGELSKKDEHIFIPHEFKGVDNDLVNGFIQQMEDSGYTVIKHHYNSDSSFFSYRVNCGDKNGYIYNPILYMPSENTINEYAIGIMSNYNLMIYYPNGNPYDKLLPYIIENNLEDIIVECVEVADYYDTKLIEVRFDLVQSIFMMILLIIIYNVSTIFYTSIYFQNNKKKIAIKMINGYGFSIHTSYIFQNIILFLSAGLIAVLLYGALLNLFIILIIDIVLFLIISIIWSHKNMATILKGES